MISRKIWVIEKSCNFHTCESIQQNWFHVNLNFRQTLTLVGNTDRYCAFLVHFLTSNWKNRYLRMSEASSTSIISLTKWVGDRSMTEWTVRNRVDQASLWKQIITLVVGSSDKKRSGALHLKLTRHYASETFNMWS